MTIKAFYLKWKLVQNYRKPVNVIHKVYWSKKKEIIFISTDAKKAIDDMQPHT